MLDEINSFIKYASTFDELSAQKNQDLGKSNISVEKFIKSTSKLSKVNFRELAKLNNLNYYDHLLIGQTLKIPPSESY